MPSLAARLPRTATAVQSAHLGEAARALVSQAYLAGLRLNEIVQLIKDADRQISAEPAWTNRKEGVRR